jgi:uncharacterized protein (DUF3820 family)
MEDLKMSKKKFSLTDNDLMPYGTYRDKLLKDIDSQYLRYIYKNHDMKRYKGLSEYIKNRLEIESTNIHL